MVGLERSLRNKTAPTFRVSPDGLHPATDIVLKETEFKEISVIILSMTKFKIYQVSTFLKKLGFVDTYFLNFLRRRRYSFNTNSTDGLILPVF